MRQIQVVVPDIRVNEVVALLSSYDKTPLHTKATGPYDTIIVHVDDSKVDEIVDLLKRRGLEEDGSIFIMPKGVSISKDEGPSGKKHKGSAMAPSIELEVMAKEESELTHSFIYLTIASAFVATLALLLDSTAAVIGAMVIAPLLGPSISVCVATVLGESKLFKNAIFNLLIGMFIAIAVSTVTAWVAIRTGLIPPLLDLQVELPREILERTNLNVVNIGLALASGAAGAYSFAEKKGEILMGVMIAVALMPPACVAGIGLALMDLQVFAGAALLLLVNVVCINIAGTIVLWKIGLRPRRLFKERESEKSVRRRVATTIAILLVLSSVFVYTTYEAYDEYQFKGDVQDKIVDTMDGVGNITEVEVQYIDVQGSDVDLRVRIYYESVPPTSDLARVIRDSLVAEFGSSYDFRITVVMERLLVSS